MQPSPEERQWAVICHLSALSGYVIPFGTVLGPLVVWLLKRELPYVDRQGKEAINFQISFLIYAVIAGLLSLLVVGIFLLVALGVLGVILIVVAAVKANEGVDFRYPVTIRFLQ